MDNKLKKAPTIHNYRFLINVCVYVQNIFNYKCTCKTLDRLYILSNLSMNKIV